jgi:hypothetical protein
VDEHAEDLHRLKLMSGLAPPAGYSWIHPSTAPMPAASTTWNEAMAHAAQGKPLMIDFTGYGLCELPEDGRARLAPEQGVLELIENDYVLASLYVDDREKLPKEEQHIYTTRAAPRSRSSPRNRWATLQAETFVPGQPALVRAAQPRWPPAEPRHGHR